MALRDYTGNGAVIVIPDPADGDAPIWDATSKTWISGAPAGGVPAAHAPSHEVGGTDEIDVDGLSGVLADEQNPEPHHLDHENGGGDEISVAGLSGVLADAQNADHFQTYDVDATEPDDGDTWVWSGTNSQWEHPNLAIASFRRMSQNIDWREEFLGGTNTGGAIGDHGWNSAVSGAGASVQILDTASSKHPGCVAIYTGTTTTGWGCLYAGDGEAVIPGALWGVEICLRVPNVPSSPQGAIIRFGLGEDTTDTQPTMGVWWEYDESVDDFWQIYTSDGGALSSDVTAVTWNANWNRFRFEYNSVASLITYYINDVSVGTLNANLCASNCSPFFQFVKTSGTTSRYIQIDYFHLYAVLTSAR